VSLQNKANRQVNLKLGVRVGGGLGERWWCGFVRDDDDANGETGVAAAE
jgi:hypothetical protein